MKIALDHVTKHYPDFDLDVTMEVPDNTITALIGTNGSGKTTTFRLMLGLARPDGGDGTILGDPIRRVGVNVKSRTGVTFGDSTFVPTFTLNNEIDERRRFYTTFDEQWCRTQLQRFMLPLNRQIQEFSTGMLAKCKTIMAMAHHPELLILDEPTTGLDVIARNEVLDLLREYMEIPGRSMLISSHIATDLENSHARNHRCIARRICGAHAHRRSDVSGRPTVHTRQTAHARRLESRYRRTWIL